MLNGSVFLRIAVLLVAAMALTGLARYYFSHDGGLPEAPLPSAPEKPAPAEPSPRAEAPPPREPPVQPSAQPLTQPSPPPPARQPTEPGPTATLAPPPEPPPIREAPAAIPAAPEAPKPQGEQSIATAEENAGPRALDLVDLNSASLAQLNALKGGGSIGRAIVQRRPYTSVDQLLSKRVLSKAVYQRIKDQVTVR